MKEANLGFNAVMWIFFIIIINKSLSTFTTNPKTGFETMK